VASPSAPVGYNKVLRERRTAPLATFRNLICLGKLDAIGGPGAKVVHKGHDVVLSCKLPGTIRIPSPSPPLACRGGSRKSRTPNLNERCALTRHCAKKRDLN
jgi:hypothetical protein